MADSGLAAARRYGEGLPAFGDHDEAERALLARRDELLQALARWTAGSVRPDGSPDSLKSMERWYFGVADGPGFGSIGSDRATVEQALAMYLGTVLVGQADPPFEWFVAEFAFGPGRYEIGVRRGPLAVMLMHHPLTHEGNKRQERLWRTYRRYAPG